MKRIFPILLCLPLLFTACKSDNNSSSEKDNSPNRDKSLESMMDVMVASCLSGNEGNPNWQAYCECAAEVMMEEIVDLGLNIADLSEDDAMSMGMEAGMDCLYLLEDDFDTSVDEYVDEYSSLGWDEFMKDEFMSGCAEDISYRDYCECVYENMILDYTVEEASTLTESDWENISIEYSDCLDYLEQ